MTEDKQLTPREAAVRILDAAKQKMQSEMDRLLKAEELGKSLFGMPSQTPSTKSLADGQPVHQQVPSKSVFRLLSQRVQKAETFINLKSPAVPAGGNAKDGGPRYTEVGKPAGNLPQDRKETSVSSDGSGGEISADNPPKSKEATPSEANLGKAAADMSMGKPPAAPKMPQAPTGQPPGVPGAKAGQAPQPPKAPGAPGMKGNTMKTETMAKGVFAKLKKQY